MYCLITISIVLTLGIIVYIILSYANFLKVLYEPFEQFSFKRIKTLQRKTVDALYYEYKNLPKGKFKLVKMKVRAWRKSDVIIQTTDFFSKAILTLMIAISGTILTIIIANLGFTSNSKTVYPSETKWLNDIIKNFNSIIDNISVHQVILVIGFCLFFIVFVDIFISNKIDNLHKRHLTVIDELEKEKS